MSLSKAKKKAWTECSKEELFRCSQCKERLPGEKFGKNYSSKNRPVSYRCRGCDALNARKRYQANPEKYRQIALKCHDKYREKKIAYMKEYGKKLKKKIFNHYGGFMCSCCGEKEKKFLTIDHINGGGTKHRKETNGGGRTTYRWIIKNNFPEGFRVLCMNCNFGAGQNNGVCPHEEQQ